jgi:hypothetical protein
MRLSARLDEYLESFGLSVMQTADLRTCYEEDMPELFITPNENLTLRELIVLQIAERQWLLHPALLRKHIVYFHAAIYLLLFIVLQSNTQTPSTPLRYAWLKT